MAALATAECLRLDALDGARRGRAGSGNGDRTSEAGNRDRRRGVHEVDVTVTSQSAVEQVCALK